MLRCMSRGHLAAAVLAATLTLASPAVASAASFPLMGWWPMNEGSGQVVRDWSGYGDHGTLGSTAGADSNDPSWIRGVLFGSALRFDGDDFVSIPDSSALKPARLTVAAWVRASGSPGILQYVLSKGSVACDHSSYGLYTSRNGGLAFYIADANTYYRSAEADPAVWDGAWHHVAGTFDGQTVRLFVDGNEVGSGTPAATAIDYTNPAGGGLIGGYPGSCENSMFLRGDIDGVQVWSQALPINTIWRALRSLFSLAR
jgi:hypothetical protein